MRSLTPGFVKKAARQSLWDVGNSVLYTLCATSPRHDRDAVIAAKVWLIGRAYAAAIERKRDSAHAFDGDTFYRRTVIPKIKHSRIDKWFRALSMDASHDIALTLKAHKKVLNLFAAISGWKKRSLASKYLHFHFPDRYYIYDTRAAQGIRALTTPLRTDLLPRRAYDETYARFFLRACAFNKQLNMLAGRCLSPREVDNILLAWNRKRTLRVRLHAET